jgi:hypothetical protein
MHTARCPVAGNDAWINRPYVRVFRRTVEKRGFLLPPFPPVVIIVLMIAHSYAGNEFRKGTALSRGATSDSTAHS